MESIDRLHEVDRRVAAALKPTPTAVQRVAAGSLREESHHHLARAHRLMPLAAVVAFAVVAAFTAATWRGFYAVSPGIPDPTLTITGTGSSIVVEQRDGRRWLVGVDDTSGGTGAAPADATASYSIVVRPTDSRSGRSTTKGAEQ